MTTVIGIASVVFTTLITGLFGWVFTTNSKINVLKAEQDVRHEALKELLTVMNTNISDRLERIERAMNGALHRG